MADQAQRGCLVRREGREGKRGPALSHKSVLGWEGQRSGKHLLWPEGTLQRPGETCCRGVCCCFSFFFFFFSSVWVDLYLGRGRPPDKGDPLQLAWDDTREAHAGQS